LAIQSRAAYSTAHRRAHKTVKNITAKKTMILKYIVFHEMSKNLMTALS
jgi:hypothetical protein